jgi:hypothetical protein
MDDASRRLKREYAALVAAVSAAIDKADPLGLLASGAPPNEYAPEVELIVARLATAQSGEDTQRIIHKAFVDLVEASAGSVEAYASVATEVWDALQTVRRRDDVP